MLTRDVQALRREIELFPDDATVWQVLPGVANSAGNVALHVAGNLQHFIGGVLGGRAYTRDRDREFNARGLPRAEVTAALDGALEALRTLEKVPAARLEETYTAAPAGAVLSTRLFLLHIVAHTGFHLGQVGYLRRALTGQSKTSGAISITELSTA